MIKLHELDVNSNTDGKELSKMDALLRYYFHIDPDGLNDDEWAQRWGELKFCLDLEGRKFRNLLGGKGNG